MSTVRMTSKDLSRAIGGGIGLQHVNQTADVSVLDRRMAEGWIRIKGTTHRVLPCAR